jgi:hypothetical protein
MEMNSQVLQLHLPRRYSNLRSSQPLTNVPAPRSNKHKNVRLQLTIVSNQGGRMSLFKIRPQIVDQPIFC